jgi:hypothetical protein
VVGNYCTFNPLDSNSGPLSNGNLDLLGNNIRSSTFYLSSGKWYFEFTVSTANNEWVGIGAQKHDSDLANFAAYRATGVYYSGSGFVAYGQRPFAYTAPSGFKALCTTNLPEPTIADGSTAMDVKTFTGNHPTGQSITSLNFSPDFVWLKDRAGTNWHYVFDTIRGTEKAIFTNATNAENTYSGTLTSFNSDGFTLGSDNATNQNGNGYVAWCWDAGTSTVTNTEGSITSQVRANASAGFSVVTYTGTLSSAPGTAPTVGHGLGVKPALIISTSRSNNEPWYVNHSYNYNNFLRLNTTAAAGDISANDGGTEADPTSTVFSTYYINGSNTSGTTYVAYCFAPVAGYSAFGSYTGNGSADGPFVYTGFRVAFLLYKKTSSATDSDWVILDRARNPSNGVKNYLFPNDARNEGVMGTGDIDFTANGYKIRATSGAVNASGGTYIYYAVAENPFQSSRAR